MNNVQHDGSEKATRIAEEILLHLRPEDGQRINIRLVKGKRGLTKVVSRLKLHSPSDGSRGSDTTLP